jgi:hypothetical protein
MPVDDLHQAVELGPAAVDVAHGEYAVFAHEKPCGQGGAGRLPPGRPVDGAPKARASLKCPHFTTLAH